MASGKPRLPHRTERRLLFHRPRWASRPSSSCNVWLPDAMKARHLFRPLIARSDHGFTAGVYLFASCRPCYEHTLYAAGMVTIVGAGSTALLSATVGAWRRIDIKRVIAIRPVRSWVTCSFAAGYRRY